MLSSFQSCPKGLFPMTVVKNLGVLHAAVLIILLQCIQNFGQNTEETRGLARNPVSMYNNFGITICNITC